MIYQFTAYYGALIRDKVIYSMELSFNDCTKFLTEDIDSEPYKDYIAKKIIADGFNPNDFTFDWLTKEQYKNKIESKVDERYEFDENNFTKKGIE
jgi:hypothetical protein